MLVEVYSTKHDRSHVSMEEAGESQRRDEGAAGGAVPGADNGDDNSHMSAGTSLLDFLIDSP